MPSACINSVRSGPSTYQMELHLRVFRLIWDLRQTLGKPNGETQNPMTLPPLGMLGFLLQFSLSSNPVVFVLFPPFIHSDSFCPFLYRLFGSTTTQRRSRLLHGYCIRVSSRSAQATVSKGLAQGPYVAARA